MRFTSCRDNTHFKFRLGHHLLSSSLDTEITVVGQRHYGILVRIFYLLKELIIVYSQRKCQADNSPKKKEKIPDPCDSLLDTTFHTRTIDRCLSVTLSEFGHDEWSK